MTKPTGPTTVTVAAHSSAISFLPPDPCAPVVVPPTPI